MGLHPLEPGSLFVFLKVLLQANLLDVRRSPSCLGLLGYPGLLGCDGVRLQLLLGRRTDPLLHVFGLGCVHRVVRFSAFLFKRAIDLIGVLVEDGDAVVKDDRVFESTFGEGAQIGHHCLRGLHTLTLG